MMVRFASRLAVSEIQGCQKLEMQGNEPQA